MGNELKPIKEPEMARELNRLRCTINEARDIVILLEEKLSPILATETPKNIGKDEESPSTTIGKELRINSFDVFSITEQIKNLISRIEL